MLKGDRQNARAYASAAAVLLSEADGAAAKGSSLVVPAAPRRDAVVLLAVGGVQVHSLTCASLHRFVFRFK